MLQMLYGQSDCEAFEGHHSFSVHESLKESVGHVQELDFQKDRLKGSHIKDAKEVQVVSECAAMATSGLKSFYVANIQYGLFI